MIEKVITFDHSVTESGHVQTREITRIMEDGVELGKSYRRFVIEPGGDTTGKDERTQHLAKAVKDHMDNVVITPELQEAIEEAEEDGVVTQEEKQSLWTKFKYY